MGIDITIARFLHIFAAMVWVGAGLTAVLVLHPLANQLGSRGSEYLRAWYGKSFFSKLMPVAAITTTAAGLFLYARLFNGGLVGALSQTGTTVLSVGALAGLLAFGHGIGIGRATDRYAAFVAQVGDNPTGEQHAQLTKMEASLGRHGMISLVLTIIAVVGMSTARYL